MKKRRTMVRVCAVSILFLFASLSAEIRMRTVDVSPYLGAYFFQDNLYFNLNHAPMYGLRLGYNITDNWGIEATGGFASTTSKEDYSPWSMYQGTKVDFWLFHLGALYNFFLENRVNPYIAFGVGGYNIAPDGFDNNMDPLLNYGGGFKYYFNDWIAFRADVRHIMSINNLDQFDSFETDFHNNLSFDIGLNFTFGGPLPDSDGDGVPDRYDRCPDTPLGVQVDEHGCPIDSDGDGVPDYLDKCPNTPPGVEVDEHGCPIDSDGDGVPDYRDKCPDTPPGVQVDEHGCPIDSDGDGVPDYLDKCPNTPPGTEVDEHGCPHPDSDGDGVCDPWVSELGLSELYAHICTGIDRCPDTPPGTEVDEHGCPIVRIILQKDDTIELENIYFELGKADLVPSSFEVLNEARNIFRDNPGIRIQIEGHTDSQGSRAYNMRLSQQRAESVMRYLVDNVGVPQDQLTAVGFGPDRPVADNRTVEGRARNRRIEFRVLSVD